MKNYLVTGGLLSLVESYNNCHYPPNSLLLSCDDITNRSIRVKEKLVMWEGMDKNSPVIHLSLQSLCVQMLYIMCPKTAVSPCIRSV